MTLDIVRIENRLRHLIVAFFIKSDLPNIADIQDTIVQWAMNYEAGYYSPIFLYNDDGLQSEDYDFLYSIDPDICYFYGSISDSLKEYITNTIQPFIVESNPLNTSRLIPFLTKNPRPAPPLSSFLWRNTEPFERSAKILDTQMTSEVGRRFSLRNFGSSIPIESSKAIPVYTLTDDPSVMQSMLSVPAYSPVIPAFLPSARSTQILTSYYWPFVDDFLLFCGNSPSLFCEFWNSHIYCSRFSPWNVKCMWMPQEYCNDELFCLLGKAAVGRLLSETGQSPPVLRLIHDLEGDIDHLIEAMRSGLSGRCLVRHLSLSEFKKPKLQRLPIDTSPEHSIKYIH